MSTRLKIIYSTTAALAVAYVQKGYSQRNPNYFAGPQAEVLDIVVMGDFPHIVEAYEAVEGCKVKAVKLTAKDDGKAPAKAKAPTKAETAKAKKDAADAKDAADTLRKSIADGDQDFLSSILVGHEVQRDGEPHTIEIEELADLDVEALREMALETVFVDS